jgi:hypothetical protein
MNRDKIDEISEDIIEKSGTFGEKVGPALIWLGKYGWKIGLSIVVVGLACIAAFGRGIFDPLKSKK